MFSITEPACNPPEAREQLAEVSVPVHPKGLHSGAWVVVKVEVDGNYKWGWAGGAGQGKTGGGVGREADPTGDVCKG